MKLPQRFLPVLATAALLATGCASGQPVDVTQLTIHTTEATLDAVTALAVAEYVQDLGIDVEVTNHQDQTAIFDLLGEDSSADHPVIGLVTAPHDNTIDERAVELPEGLDAIAAAPTELDYVAATSSMTAQRFRQARARAEDSDAPLAEACTDHTWYHFFPEVSSELEQLDQGLAGTGCDPEFMSAGNYAAVVDRVLREPASAVMLYSIDPALADAGLTTLDLGATNWPRNVVVAVAGHEPEQVLTGHLSAVLGALDTEAATRLLRGYHQAQASTSDLDYDIEHAVRYWLAEHDLIDPDTVTNITDAAQ